MTQDTPRVEILPVTQEDRELASLCAVTPEYREYILSGRGDASLYVQVLARHRTAAEDASRAEIEALREALADCAWGLETAKNALAWAARRMACRDYANVIENDARNAGIVLERARALLTRQAGGPSDA